MNRLRSVGTTDIVTFTTSNEGTLDMAVGVAMVERDAYRNRFPHIPQEDIEDALSANPLNPDHIAETLVNLDRGPERGWHWALAIQRGMGYVSVHGFALCLAEEEGIALYELHVHPDAQRQRLATVLAHSAITSALQGGPYARSGEDTQLSLFVARERPNDPAEHPAAWYRSLGLRPTGAGMQLSIGDFTAPSQQLTGRVGDALAELESRLPT